MKPMTQTLMIALAIVFSIALSLTVSLICLSYADGSSIPEEESDKTYPVQTTGIFPLVTEPLPPAETTAALTTPEVTTEAETLLPDVSNGLKFVSNRNGTCRVTDIGTCTDACVVIPSYSPMGDRVVEIDDGAFFGCATVAVVQIPATVKKIGDLAFAACPNLMYLSVSAENSVYRDVEGVLYSADLAVLIQYPPMRAGNELLIRAETTLIKEMAFYSCTYLKSILYTGSPQQWEDIVIESKNYSLTAAAKTFHHTI